jgi:general secretion pathway protein N
MAALRWPWVRRQTPLPPRYASTLSSFGESTYAELAWQRSRAATRRWAYAGAVVGAILGLLAFAPASWLAAGASSASGGRLVLAEARGTVWNGSAIAVLTGGEGSRDAASLPGRFEWKVGWRGAGPELRIAHPCCLSTPLTLALKPGFGRLQVSVTRPAGLPAGAPLARWPAEWLAGLGTPWNTMQLGGDLRVSTPGLLTLEWVQGRWIVAGRVEIELLDVSSRLSTIEPLGSYRLTIAGDPANPGTSTLTLATLNGALLLSGRGSLGSAGLRFRGEASAAPADEAALNNLLNIIGRRSGARSIIAIG